MKAALVLSVLSASLLFSTAPVTAQDAPLWRYTTAENIEFYRVTPTGDLIIRTKDGIVVLDPATGEPKWTRDDVLQPPGGFSSSDVVNDVSWADLFPYPAQQYNPIPLTQFGVSRTNDDLVMIDLGTGVSMWDSPDPSRRSAVTFRSCSLASCWSTERRPRANGRSWPWTLPPAR